MNTSFMLLALILIIVQIVAQTVPLENQNDCPTPMINFQGKCFDKISGCQIYKNGTECQKCDQASNLIDGKCVKDLPLGNPIIFAPLQQKSMNPKSSANEVKLKFIDQVNMNTIKNLIFTNYPSFANSLVEPFLINVIKSSYETYYLFKWTNSKNRTFLFEFGINFEGTTTELISDDWDQNLENSAFSKIYAKLSLKYSEQLMVSSLTRIEAISKNLFKLHYYSDFGFHYMAFIQKIPFLEIKSLQTLPWKYDEQEMLQYVYSQHPFLLRESSWKVQKRENQKGLQNQIIFSSESQAVLEQVPEQRLRIIFFKREENQTISVLGSNSKLVGRLQVLRDKSDESVRSVLDHLFKEFSILKNLEVVKIQYQMVAGVIYLIHFKDKSINDLYICKVFYSLSGQINIMEIYFNSILIHSQPLAPLQINSFDFKADPLFQEVDTFMRSSKGLKIPEKILYVNKVLKSNEINTFYMFEIVFESNSFIIASYFTEGTRKGTIELNDFIYNGDNQLDQEDQSQLTQQIKAFLQGYRPWLKPLIIEYLKQTKPNEYLLKVMTKYGSYYFKVVDKELTGYEIYYYQLIDEKENCLTHSVDYIQQFLLTQKPSFTALINSYSAEIDSGSELVAFSQGIQNSQTKYRFLFFNPANNKKVQVLAHQDKFSFVVDTVISENFGLHDINDANDYARSVQKAALTFPDQLKDAKPIYGLVNSSHVLTYFSKQYEQKESVMLVTFDIVLQNGVIQTLVQNQIQKSCSKFDTKGNCEDCNPNSIGFMSRCFDQIKNCRKQIGNVCLACQNEYSLVNNVCTNDCGLLM